MDTLLEQARTRFDAVRKRHRQTAPAWESHRFAVRVCAVASGGDAPDGLAGALAQRVAALDGAMLDDVVTDASDAGLAACLMDGFAAREPLMAEVAPTLRQGVRLGPLGLSAWRRFRFEAAHRLPNLPATHKCSRLHGHGFEVSLRVRVDAAAVSEADAALVAAWQGLAPRLDGTCLNDVGGLENPTSEELAVWLWRMLAPELDLLAVSVFETCTSACHFDGTRTRIAKSFRFESALDGPRGVFGHSYQVRLHAAGELDEQLGWVLDFGDMKRLFEPAYRQLDHRHLDTVLGQAATPGAIANWISDRLRPDLPTLVGVDVQPTPDRAVLLRTPEHARPD